MVSETAQWPTASLRSLQEPQGGMRPHAAGLSALPQKEARPGLHLHPFRTHTSVRGRGFAEPVPSPLARLHAVTEADSTASAPQPPRPPFHTTLQSQSQSQTFSFKTTDTNLSKSPAPRTSGHLGFTSHSAVYQETSQRLSRLQGTPSTSHTPRPTIDPNLSSPSNVEPIPPEMLEMCQVVLGNLSALDISRMTKPPRTPLNIRDTWANMLAVRVMQSLENHVGGDDENRGARLEHLGDLLRGNTAQPILEEAATVEEWIAKYTGANLRWESIALLFTYGDQPERSNKLTTEGNRREGRNSPWRRFALHNLNLCIKLSKMFSDVLSCWVAHSETVALLTFMGLHVEQETSSYVPTFTSELRRRLCANVFNIDKAFLGLQGRPPLLCHRYVSTSPPLDMPDEAFLGDIESFRASVSEMDELGWNMTGVMSAVTVARGRTVLACVRDELIGMALANKKHISIEDILSIKKKAREAIDELPQCLMYREGDIHDYSIRYDLVYACLYIRLEYLQNLFIVERLLHRRGANTDDELLLISFEMVALTLKFWTHQDRFAGAINDFEGLVMECQLSLVFVANECKQVMSYAAPGGGVLSMELLRPTFSGPHHPRKEDMTRSSIVQQLSLLVGFLGWVGPDAPNADLCASCRTVIQQVLDHTFNQGVTLSMEQEQAGLFQHHESNEYALDEPTYRGDASLGFDLLDTFSWLRSDDLSILGMRDSTMV
ncbi:hypothetical protein HJFPF1_12267 [Paramyrothecium foliicola]|nr:hypothetical protein HJFPF1_12267 [Paramyrothecium foliicola]